MREILGKVSMIIEMKKPYIYPKAGHVIQGNIFWSGALLAAEVVTGDRCLLRLVSHVVSFLYHVSQVMELFRTFLRIDSEWACVNSLRSPRATNRFALASVWFDTILLAKPGCLLTPSPSALELFSRRNLPVRVGRSLLPHGSSHLRKR